MAEPTALRIACCAPLPPAPTGVADFAAEQIRALVALAKEVRAYHPRSLAAAPIPGAFTGPLDCLEADGPFDAVLIHLGNHARFHGELLDLALATPSVVVLHEVDLRHLLVGATIGRGEPAGFLRMLRWAYGSSGEAAGRRWLDQGAAAGLRNLPCFEPVVDASRGVVVHTEWARQRILAARPHAAVRKVPHPLPRRKSDPDPERGSAFRRRYGVALDACVVGVFGFVTAAKRLPQVLRAFRILRRQRPGVRMLVAGDRSPDPTADDLLTGPLGEGVLATGRLPIEDLEAAMAAADVAVSLRHPPGGEASGTALRLLDLGRPLVVSDAGWCAEIPEGAVVHVAPDRHEITHLASALLALADDTELRTRVGEAGRAWARSNHDPDRCARAMATALAELSRLDPPHPSPEPRARRNRWPDAALAESAGRAMADLGSAEDDAELVRVVSHRLRELGTDL